MQRFRTGCETIDGSVVDLGQTSLMFPHYESRICVKVVNNSQGCSIYQVLLFCMDGLVENR